jgi:signal transduction histidine kinase
VAHEALIRGWSRLRGWVEEDRESLRIHRHLAEAANDWESAERDESFLHRGTRLAQEKKWAETHLYDLNPLERLFLDASAALQQQEREERAHIIAVAEGPRKRLARDLHDGPTQSIAAIAMRLNYLRMSLDREQDLRQTAEELMRIEELARRATKETRHLLFTLRPLILETEGLLAALEQYVSKLAETDPTPIHLEATPEVEQALGQDAQGLIFYIIDEAIRNARTYAKPGNIWVRLYVQDTTFVAEVEDDGVGFDMDTVQARYDQRHALGMINMYERAELIGGTLTIASAPGKGTLITLTVSLLHKHEQM